ncbi:WxL domain-containing protein [Enterococcus faecalis]|uniref:WxL domain-containing protein n=2 Tax=Enterococcus faecalis TaxID=1351 RepID=UPI0035EF4BE9
MKQTKWQRLATIGLCSSLVINAFSGVTAVAETVTIESSPTAESSAKEETPASSVKEETTKASTENSQETTDTSQEEVEQTEKTETTESANVAADLVGERENEVTSIPEIKSIQPKAAVAFPAKTYQFGFVNEAGQLINPANIPITYSYAKGSWTPVIANLRWTMVPGNASTVGNLKNVTMPASSIATPPGPTWAGNTEVYANFSIKIPRYYSSLSLYDRTGKINPTYPLPSIAHIGDNAYTFTQADVITWLGLTSKGNNMYALKETYYNGDPAALKFPIFMMRLNELSSSGYLTQYSIVNQPIYYHLTNRRVTENFVDTNGAKITPPSNFTQGKQTVINSDPYTFQQSGFLPETYKVGTKSYRFKGWYKGKTKTEPLATTKTPSYKVTYDGNDDLTVVYEEFSGYELPASTNQFGFVDEATNKLIAPDKVQMKYNLTLNENNKKTVMSSSLTGTDTATLKNLSVPVNYFEQYRVNTFYGASDITFTLPKRYKSINITKSDGKTDPAFPIPKIYNKDQVEMSHMPVTTYNKLKQLSGQTFGFNALADQPEFYTKMLFGTESGIDDPINYYTMSGPVYYYLENRKVTENFVDTSGAKITAPTGFTQGKKTVITSDAYTFKQAGTLPDTYTTGGKTYKFKGWYKGKTKPSTLTTTKAPSYGVTYDDNDDLNVVYEETKEKTTTIPAVTYKFGFVDEKGTLVAPTNFNMTTNLTTIMNGTPKQVGTASGVNNGNLKQLTIPSQQLTYTPSVNPAYSGSTNLRLIIPKRYKLPTVKPGTYYTGSSTAYPIATTRMRYVGGVLPDDRLKTDGSDYTLATTTTAHSYRLRQFLWESDATKTTFDSTLSVANATGNAPAYYTTDETMYYFLENRRVTENFVDTSGAKITAPTGFTQGKKTVITSDAYTFKQAGTLPDTYTTGGKTYKFKGWYKGKSILNTLTTTKAPSYQVTYDDNDDLNVVYEEVKTFDFPESTYQFGFVDVATGNLIEPSLVNMNYTLWQQEDGIQTNLVANQKGVNVGNLKSFTIPEKKYQQKASSTWYGPYNMSFTIPKQYKTIDVTKTDGTTDSAYPIPTVTNYKDEPVNITPRKYNKLKLVSGQTFEFNEVIRGGLPEIYSKTLYGTDVSTSSTTVYYKQKGPVYYYLTNRTVTENFVDTSGAKITPPTGFTQGNQIPMTNDAFKYTAAKSLPATYTAGGKTYTFQGWYKGKAKPSTLNQTTTPTFNATFDDNDDMTAMYKEEVPRASAMLIRTTDEMVASGGNVTWRATITNPSKAPLTTATIKKSTAWTTGLAAPTSMIVTPVGGTAKTVPVTATTWTNGVSLGIDIPAGKTATVQFTTRATGTAGQVLRASITTSGNYSGVSASATVRVKDNDQEVVTPTTEGFISVPTFDFGQVGVAGSKQQHSLKQAADYYGNGTRNPYLRIKKTQPNWSLTAQLSQPKSATDSLPTATRLLLGAAPVSSFTNYNQPTELKNAVGTTSAISLTANNTATSIIANKQFTGSNVYQLDFTFNNVKLEVPANQGVKGQQYKAAVTWNLVTGP